MIMAQQKAPKRKNATHLDDVLLELGGHGLLELGGHAGNLVFVRATLERREDRLVDLATKVALVLRKAAGGGSGGWGGGRQSPFAA